MRGEGNGPLEDAEFRPALRSERDEDERRLARTSGRGDERGLGIVRAPGLDERCTLGLGMSSISRLLFDRTDGRLSHEQLIAMGTGSSFCPEAVL